MSALLGFISIEAVKGAAVSLLQWIGRAITAVFFLVVFCAALSLVLPADPFRPAIVEAATLIAQYSKWVNLILPVSYIITSTLFVVSFKYFIFAYKKLGGVLMDSAGQAFFDV